MIEQRDIATGRRGFLGQVTAGALAFAASGMHAPLLDAQGQPASGQEADKWLDLIKGTHKQIFDAVSVNEGFPLAFALNFLDTNKATYMLADKDMTAVVGLRHMAIPIAFNDTIWKKYELGELLKVDDPKTKMPAVRNLWYKPAQGELMFPGMAYDALQTRGTVFTVCNVALTVLSGMAADAAKVSMAKDAARKEWMANLLPGATIVPSGVLAVNRAQEKGCTYCFAG
jgi:intracellular sulfur oxidation DsrE/DsrF family protein